MGSKSTFSNSTSKSYALALYELSKDSSELDNVESQMKSLNALLKESKDFREIVSSPTVSKEEKKNVILEVANNNSFPETLKKFLGLVAIRNRLFFLDKIIESFLNLVADNKGELKAKLISSKKLTEDQKKEIENDLSKDFQSKLNLDYKHDPDLIAGLIIQVGSIMVDTSVKTKLKNLKKNMLEV